MGLLQIEGTEQLAGARAAGGERTVVLVGNPNSGKTTLFNALTGGAAKVANYPGTTVDRRSAPCRPAGAFPIRLVDTPGAYSLYAKTRDEELAVQEILGLDGAEQPDGVVLILDALSLERGLYMLTLLLDFDVPVVVAVNMIDDARRRRFDVDLTALRETFGVPFLPIVARTGEGLDELRSTLEKELLEPSPPPGVGAWQDDRFRSLAAGLEAVVGEHVPHMEEDGARRAFAVWALMSAENEESMIVPEIVHQAALEMRRRLDEEGRDLVGEVVLPRYAFIDSEVQPRLGRPATVSRTDKIDAVLTHPLWGGLIFAALMLTIFQGLFSWAEPFMDFIEASFDVVRGGITSVMPQGLLRDALTEGLIPGVAAVVVFLPQILFLFFFLTLLESSGYMARVAFLIDRMIKRVGLHGNAFIPMMGGLACAVPAIMAVRTIESRRDRILTMMVIPLMSCSARLPVYTLILATLFPADRTVIGPIGLGSVMLFGMYVLSTMVALGVALVLGRTMLKGQAPPLVLELPPYRAPTMRTLLRTLWGRAKDFLTTAGQVILVLSVVLWVLLSFPRVDPSEISGQPIESSYAGRLGRALEPALEPLGFDWKIGIGLIGSFAAREVFVSTMGVVYGIEDAEEAGLGDLRAAMRADTRDDGSLLWTPLTGFSLMVFFMIAMQCMSTVAIVRRESRSWKWPIVMIVYMTVLAYLASLLVFQAGSLLGFG